MRTVATNEALAAVHEAAEALTPEQRGRVRAAMRRLAEAHLQEAVKVEDDARKRYRFGAWAVAEIADVI